MLSEHLEHGDWKKVGRCVYCECGTRLYQGSAPKNEIQKFETAAAVDELIEAVKKRLLEKAQGDV